MAIRARLAHARASWIVVDRMATSQANSVPHEGLRELLRYSMTPRDPATEAAAAAKAMREMVRS